MGRSNPACHRSSRIDIVLVERPLQRSSASAHALWEAGGRPDGRALDYWLQAEQEIVNQSVAGEEDPLAGIDQEAS
jgi:hypothetical protein